MRFSFLGFSNLLAVRSQVSWSEFSPGPCGPPSRSSDVTAGDSCLPNMCRVTVFFLPCGTTLAPFTLGHKQGFSVQVTATHVTFSQAPPFYSRQRLPAVCQTRRMRRSQRHRSPTQPPALMHRLNSANEPELYCAGLSAKGNVPCNWPT